MQYFADKTFALRFARKPYCSFNASRARGATQFVDMGAMFGGVFAGVFIGYNGTHTRRSFCIGIGFSVALIIIKLLPRKLEKAFLLLCKSEDTQVKTARDADYYDAQMFWETRHMYHKSYPLYKYLSDDVNPRMLVPTPMSAVSEQEPPPTPSYDIPLPPSAVDQRAHICFHSCC
jgi:hypothetical protein